MPIQSDVTVNATKLTNSSITENTRKINEVLTAATQNGPEWHKVGAAKYREMCEAGETPNPIPVYLPNATDETVPSQSPGRDIPVRICRPDNGQPSKGLFMHIHRGGYVLFTHREVDSTLQRYANECQLTAMSIGYRLAPEDPYPAALEDCYDAITYLVDHGEAKYGAKLLFVGGESAGAHASAMSCFRLMRTRPEHRLLGLVLTSGWFDMSLSLPQSMSFSKPLIINNEILARFSDAFLPGRDGRARRGAAVSPLHVDMRALAASSPYHSLPPALFTCGTEDPLLDDSVLMGCKWQMAGSEGIVRLLPGVSHGFESVPGLHEADATKAAIVQFINEKLGAR